jgi:VanZ family protein
MKFLRDWGPVIAWAGLIFFFSTDLFSGAQTSRFLIPFLRWLFPGASAHTLHQIHLYVRKSGHIIEYSIFSLLLYRGIRGGRAGWRITWALAAVAIAACYAALDEVHQAFVPSRGPSAFDVLLDTCGAAAAQVLAWLWPRRQSPE